MDLHGILFLLIFFVLGGRYNGTYMLDSMSADGMTITADDLSAFGMTNFGIKISFGKCEFVGGEDYGFDEAGTSKIKISGGKVTITDTDGLQPVPLMVIPSRSKSLVYQ